MKFARNPENDFAQYIRTYYQECRFRFDRIEAIAGKWTFRDLIPGMSDFDTRFICANDMTADDWCRMSMAIGDAHLALCRKFTGWWRNLEHLPGVNLTWDELTSERLYYPEFQQWMFYDTEAPRKVSAALQHFAGRPWDAKDELFHLKKFCLYYGRYDRQIDKPINMGMHESKYPSHSRLMHYFAPPVQSAVSILARQNIAGKFDALEMAERQFGRLACWDMIHEILNADYRTAKWCEEPDVSRLEDALEEALKVMAAALREVITLVPREAGVNVSAWKKALQSVPVDPALTIFENAKFSRLMKGRLWFYANVPPIFDSTWLIINELNRIGNSFFLVPFRTYWQIRTGRKSEEPAAIVNALRGSLLTEAEADATLEFHRLTQRVCDPGKEKETALAIVAAYDGFFKALTKISEDVEKYRKEQT